MSKIITQKDILEDSIAVTRRWFLLGSTSTVAALAVGTSTIVRAAEAPRLSFEVLSACDYAQRYVSRMWVSQSSTDKPKWGKLEVKINDGGTIIGDNFSLLSGWMIVFHPGNQLMLSRDNVLKMLLTPAPGMSFAGIQFDVGLSVHDLDDDGNWNHRSEHHLVPGGLSTLRELSPKSREMPGWLVRQRSVGYVSSTQQVNPDHPLLRKIDI